MEGYPDIETYISDLNALIHGHQMKMAAIFAQRDVVTKLLKDQVTVCDTLAESIKNCQSSDTGVPSETGVQDIIEAMAKRKYYDEELMKINLEGEKITMDVICENACERSTQSLTINPRNFYCLNNFIRRNGNIYDIQFLFLFKTQEYFRIIVTFIFVLTFLEIFKNRGFHLCKI